MRACSFYPKFKSAGALQAPLLQYVYNNMKEVDDGDRVFTHIDFFMPNFFEVVHKHIMKVG